MWWHTAARFRVSLRGDVPFPSRAGHRERNARSFHSLPARVAAEFLSTSGERTAPEPSRSIAPKPTGAAAPGGGETPLAPGMPQAAPSRPETGRFTHFRHIQREREREGERGEERGRRALCFRICARDVKWICLIEFMTQREPRRGWEVESGGGGIKFAADFYTRTIGGNAKQPLVEGVSP